MSQNTGNPRVRFLKKHLNSIKIQRSMCKTTTFGKTLLISPPFPFLSCRQEREAANHQRPKSQQSHLPRMTGVPGTGLPVVTWTAQCQWLPYLTSGLNHLFLPWDVCSRVTVCLGSCRFLLPFCFNAGLLILPEPKEHCKALPTLLPRTSCAQVKHAYCWRKKLLF